MIMIAWVEGLFNFLELVVDAITETARNSRH
jgi:hypothetical protein